MPPHTSQHVGALQTTQLWFPQSTEYFASSAAEHPGSAASLPLWCPPVNVMFYEHALQISGSFLHLAVCAVLLQSPLQDGQSHREQPTNSNLVCVLLLGGASLTHAFAPPTLTGLRWADTSSEA